MTAAYDVPLARVRKRTESMTRMSKLALEVGRTLYPEDTREGRPQTYGDCVRAGLGGEHPCPYVSCVHHLALDVSLDTGSVTTNFPGRDIDEIPATCDLAVAELGGLTLEEVGAVMNLTHERTRQIERVALAKLEALLGHSFEDLATEALAGSAPEVRTVPRRHDDTQPGERFGRLVVLATHTDDKGFVIAKCLCDCGNVRSARVANLRERAIVSCGCKRREGRR